jgi:dynein heavy chain
MPSPQPHSPTLTDQHCVWLGQLEMCQKFLTGYLDSKRDAFPRLYFVSDTVLLESLSSSSDLNSLQPLLLSLFDSVRSLTVDKRTESVTGMVSQEGESLECLVHISSELPVEALLASVQEEMRHSLATQAVEIATTGQELLAREDVEKLFQTFQCQICVLGLQIWYTALCSKVSLHSVIGC